MTTFFGPAEYFVLSTYFKKKIPLTIHVDEVIPIEALQAGEVSNPDFIGSIKVWHREGEQRSDS